MKRKKVSLPFRRLSARALIVRRSDGALLGTLHRQDGMYALPGGAPKSGESTLEAVTRELKEEKIDLVGADETLKDALVVDYFSGYGELSVWHMFLVDDARIGETGENVESRWIRQEEDVWYPTMREKILMAIGQHLARLAARSIEVR